MSLRFPENAELIRQSVTKFREIGAAKRLCRTPWDQGRRHCQGTVLFLHEILYCRTFQSIKR
jgi:hypothetical protein